MPEKSKEESTQDLINFDTLSVFKTGEPKPIFKVFQDLYKIYFPDETEVVALLEGRLSITPDVSRRMAKLIHVIRGFDTDPMAFYDAQKNFDISYAQWLKNRAR